MGSEFSQKVLAVPYGGATFVPPTFVPPTFFPLTFVPQDICAITTLVPPLANKQHLCHHGQADRWTDRQTVDMGAGVREQSPLLRDEKYSMLQKLRHRTLPDRAVPDVRGDPSTAPPEDEEY
jgi:hypothetical protein